MQKQTPLISVIMPLYNAERFVGESIENVLRQTVGDFELIVIDDASTDASAEIARAYAAKDDRIVLMHNELNSGAARTRNRALDAARGKFITFMDADDLCSPERFAKQLAFFERHPQTDICGSYYTMFGTRGGGRPSRVSLKTTREIHSKCRSPTRKSSTNCFSGARSACRPSCCAANLSNGPAYASGSVWPKTISYGSIFRNTSAWPTFRST